MSMSREPVSGSNNLILKILRQYIIFDRSLVSLKEEVEIQCELVIMLSIESEKSLLTFTRHDYQLLFKLAIIYKVRFQSRRS